MSPDMQHLGALPDWPQEIAEQFQSTAVHPTPAIIGFSAVPSSHRQRAHWQPRHRQAHRPSRLWAGHRHNQPDQTVDHAHGKPYRQPTFPVTPETSSCLTMTGPSRHAWTHQIPQDRSQPRGQRRLSLMFGSILKRDEQID